MTAAVASSGCRLCFATGISPFGKPWGFCDDLAGSASMAMYGTFENLTGEPPGSTFTITSREQVLEITEENYSIVYCSVLHNLRSHTSKAGLPLRSKIFQGIHWNIPGILKDSRAKTLQTLDI